MRDLKCPYCEVKQTNYAGYEEDVRYVHKCTKCRKIFVFETEVSVDYTSSKADCLNGAEHTTLFRKRWPERFSQIECKDCHSSRLATPEEFAAEKPLGALK